LYRSAVASPLERTGLIDCLEGARKATTVPQLMPAACHDSQAISMQAFTNRNKLEKGLGLRFVDDYPERILPVCQMAAFAFTDGLVRMTVLANNGLSL